MTKQILSIFIIVLILSFEKVNALNKIDSLHKVVIVSKDTIEIMLKKSSFEKRLHKIEFSKTEFIINRQDSIAIPNRIDGHDIYGTDGELPHFEISVFEISWNRQKIKIPKNLYFDCYEPNFDEDSRMIRFIPSKDGSQILIEMSASDGAGSYSVWWIISKNGKHQRFVSDNGC